MALGWFNKQIRERKQNDQQVFEDSIFHMASVVLGRTGADAVNDERLVSKAAIDEILKYFHHKPAEIPQGGRQGGRAASRSLCGIPVPRSRHGKADVGQPENRGSF